MLYNEKCPLCGSTDCNTYFVGSRPARDYFLCPQCDLIFVPSRFHLYPKEEKEIYDQHQNSPDDPNYRAFLSKLFNPMRERLATGSSGLDFGSGPGPTLSIIFNESGFKCAVYDKFYADTPNTLEKDYDFVSSTEVVEHLADPKSAFQLLFKLLKSRRGILGVMTKLHPQNPNEFERWHYKNDPTHISFYSDETLRFIAASHHYAVTIIGNDVAIFEPL